MKRTHPFILGLLSITDIFGSNTPKKDKRTDAEKLASDWCAVGMDIRNAMSEFALQQ